MYSSLTNDGDNVTVRPIVFAVEVMAVAAQSMTFSCRCLGVANNRELPPSVQCAAELSVNLTFT